MVQAQISIEVGHPAAAVLRNRLDLAHHLVPTMATLFTVLLAAIVSPAQEVQPPKDLQPNTIPTPPSFSFLHTPPRGLPKMPLPADYAPTAAMYALGERLFHDGVLSRDGTVSCATCHPAASGFASPAATPLGIGGQAALRHAPTLFNRGWGTLQRWDGGSASLEQFVLEPIADPREMGSSVDAALARLAANADYERSFREAFGGPADAVALQRALATFVRGITLGDAAYDRFVAGEHDALTPQQRHGLWLFESRAKCWQCHTPPLFTDEGFHNTGVGAERGLERARAAITGEAADTGRFRTPTLRGLRLTAPYMHDGSITTLVDVVAFYARGGGANEHLDARMQRLELSAADQRALVAFLESL
jgi:cytochrome c peroxidase